MNYRHWSLLLLVAGIALWLCGGALILFSEMLLIRLFGVALFAVGPSLVFFAGRMVRARR